MRRDRSNEGAVWSNGLQSPGTEPVPETDAPAIEAAKNHPLAPTGADAWNNFCEATELPGSPTDPSSARYFCENTPGGLAPGSAPPGWCYVDPRANPPVGSAALLSACPSTSRGLVRFVGDPFPPTGPTYVAIVCPPA